MQISSQLSLNSTRVYFTKRRPNVDWDVIVCETSVSIRSDINTTTLIMGDPQGCMLSHLLFILMTHDCVAQREKHYQD